MEIKIAQRVYLFLSCNFPIPDRNECLGNRQGRAACNTTYLIFAIMAVGDLKKDFNLNKVKLEFSLNLTKKKK